MTSQAIKLNIPSAQAEKFRLLPEDEKEILASIITDLLSEENLDLPLLMDFIGFRAQKRGLTLEILTDILNEKNNTN